VIGFDPFLEAHFRIITPEVFEFVFENELKRAVRSQNFLTFVSIEPRSGSGEEGETIREVARVISNEIRGTDLLTATPQGRLSMVLLDADMTQALRVIERLMARLEPHEFAAPLNLDIGAACCPTDGSDADALRRVAAQKSGLLRRGPGGTDSKTS
jgi:GGDEF domain-containing protein